MKNLFSLGTIVSILLATNVVIGQDDKSIETMLINELNRIQGVFQLANNGLIGTRELEPVEEQISKFSELQLQKEAIQKAIPIAAKTKDQKERIAKLRSVLDEMQSLESSLKEKILLPHQKEMLKQTEFSLLLSRLNGDIAKVIDMYYEEQFELTKKQEEQLADLRAENDAKKRALGREYQKKLQELDVENSKKLTSIFSPRQREIIERLSGKKIVPDYAVGKKD